MSIVSWRSRELHTLHHLTHARLYISVVIIKERKVQLLTLLMASEEPAQYKIIALTSSMDFSVGRYKGTVEVGMAKR